MDCPTHSGQSNAANRANYDAIMRGLYDNQSGDGRHKCPYCAYEEGRRDAFRRVANKIAELTNTIEEIAREAHPSAGSSSQGGSST